MDVYADNPPCFRYDQTELDHLRARDPRLAAAIDRIGLIRREVQPDLFHALVHSIIGQQISTKAQVTIWGKVQARFPGVSPEVMASCALDELQGVGITFRKAGYIQDIARRIVDGSTDLHALAQLEDEALWPGHRQLRGSGHSARHAHALSSPGHHATALCPLPSSLQPLWQHGQSVPVGDCGRGAAGADGSGQVGEVEKMRGRLPSVG